MKQFKTKTCDVCGKPPAYYSRLADKNFCEMHFIQFIAKFLTGAAIIGGIVAGLLYIL